MKDIQEHTVLALKPFSKSKIVLKILKSQVTEGTLWNTRLISSAFPFTCYLGILDFYESLCINSGHGSKIWGLFPL